MLYNDDVIFLSLFLFAFICFMMGIFSSWTEKQRKKAADDVREAERKAFIEQPKESDLKLRQLIESKKGIKDCKLEIDNLIEESKDTISLGSLFNLYSKQIEKYQQETRSRASWSFLFATLSMLAGFGFVIWGGSVLLTADEPIVLASSGLLSTIGGIVSGFITKTFLDVHKLSLLQLNKYFQQPVINDHILMAQKLADEMDDQVAKIRAYEKIISSITKLIENDNEPTQGVS